MKTETLSLLATTCLVTFSAGWLTVDLRAQSQDQSTVIHVCAEQDGVLKMVDLSTACGKGQRSLLLQKWSPPDPPKPDDDKNSCDPNKLKDLEQRVQKLEDSPACSSKGKTRVEAPFEVVDASGKRIFYVDDGIVQVYNGAGAEVARITASSGGGSFEAKSNDNTLTATFGVSDDTSGLVLTENGQTRIELGRKHGTGTYRALFYNGGGKAVAGIGQTSGGFGEAVVADDGGVYKARMQVTDGKGRINITTATMGFSIAELTEGAHGGGHLFLCTPSGCDPPMVEAGDAGGYGIVRTGPMGFNPGVGLLGLPGSFIMGKR